MRLGLRLTGQRRPGGGGPTPPSTASRLTLAHGETMPSPGYQATTWTVQNGNWNDPATWAAGVPGATDKVYISHTVTVTDQTAAASGVLAAAAGTLAFDPTANTRLTVTTLAVDNGGTLQMGTAAVPVNAAKTCEIVIRDTALPSSAVDWHQFSNGILVMSGGTWRAHGDVKTPFVRLGADVAVTDTAVALASSPSGWRAGDDIALPFSNPAHGVGRTIGDCVNEEFTVGSVVGSTVNLGSAVAYAHPGAKNKTGTTVKRPHLANLSRNVVIRSENPSGVRGHTLATERADVDLRWVRFSGLGRTTGEPLDSATVTSEVASGGANVTHYGTNQVGRYPVHMHHAFGPEAGVGTVTGHGFSGVADPFQYQFRLEGLVTDDCLKWGHVVHGSSYGFIKDCVAWDFQAAGFSYETGNEWYNLMGGCFAANGYNAGGHQIVCNSYWIMAAAANGFKDLVGGGLLQAETTTFGQTYQGHVFHYDRLGRGGIPLQLLKRPLYAGADVLHGAEGVDYETVGATDYGFGDALDGVEAYGCLKGVSIDHVGGPGDLTLRDVVVWGYWTDACFIYGGQAGVLVEGLYAYRWVECGWQPNTWGGEIRLVGGEIHSYDHTLDSGIECHGFEKFGDAPVADRLFIKDLDIYAPGCVSFNYRGKITKVLPDDTTGSNRLPTAVTVLDGVTTHVHATAVSPYRYRMMTAAAGTTGDTFLGFEQIFIRNHEGSAGTHYQVFFDEQAPDQPCPEEDGISGTTNAEQYALDGRCWGGELMPVVATTLAELTGGKVATPAVPAVAAAEILPSGGKLRVTFDRFVASPVDLHWWRGAFDGFALTASGGAVALAWKRTPPAALVGQGASAGEFIPVPYADVYFDLSRPIARTETLTLAYAPGAVEAVPGVGFGLAAFSGTAVTNNSTNDGTDTLALKLEADHWLAEASGTRADHAYPAGLRGLADLNSSVGSAAGVDGTDAAAAFDADTDALTISGDWTLQNGDWRYPLATRPPLGPVTEGLWVRLDRVAYPDVILGAGSTTGLNLRVGPSNNFELFYNATALRTGTAQVGVWTYLLASYDPAARTLSLSQDGGTPATTTAAVTFGRTDGEYRLGALSGGGQPFRGRLQYHKTWHRLLTGGEPTAAMAWRPPAAPVATYLLHNYQPVVSGGPVSG